MTNADVLRLDFRLRALRRLARELAARTVVPEHVDALEVAISSLDRADSVEDDEAALLARAAALSLFGIADAIGYDELNAPLTAAGN